MEDHPFADRIMRALQYVNDGELSRALAQLDSDTSVPELGSAAERLRGCLEIRLGRIDRGFGILDQNRVKAISPWRAPCPYRFVVEATELERVSRGLFDCLATHGTPDAIAGVSNSYATASTLSHVRVLGRRLKLDKRTADSRVALAMYDSWLRAALAETPAECQSELIADLKERLLRWSDRSGARELDERYAFPNQHSARDDR